MWTIGSGYRELKDYWKCIANLAVITVLTGRSCTWKTSNLKGYDGIQAVYFFFNNYETNCSYFSPVVLDSNLCYVRW